MTNADRIRNMTDNELYEFLGMFEEGDIDYAVTFCDMCNKYGNTLGLDCDGCLNHWLSSDADAYNGINSFPWFNKAGEQE